MSSCKFEVNNGVGSRHAAAAVSRVWFLPVEVVVEGAVWGIHSEGTKRDAQREKWLRNSFIPHLHQHFYYSWSSGWWQKRGRRAGDFGIALHAAAAVFVLARENIKWQICPIVSASDKGCNQGLTQSLHRGRFLHSPVERRQLRVTLFVSLCLLQTWACVNLRLRANFDVVAFLFYVRSQSLKMKNHCVAEFIKSSANSTSRKYLWGSSQAPHNKNSLL